MMNLILTLEQILLWKTMEMNPLSHFLFARSPKLWLISCPSQNKTHMRRIICSETKIPFEWAFRIANSKLVSSNYTKKNSDQVVFWAAYTHTRTVISILKYFIFAPQFKLWWKIKFRSEKNRKSNLLPLAVANDYFGRSGWVQYFPNAVTGVSILQTTGRTFLASWKWFLIFKWNRRNWMLNRLTEWMLLRNEESQNT